MLAVFENFLSTINFHKRNECYAISFVKKIMTSCFEFVINYIRF